MDPMIIKEQQHHDGEYSSGQWVEINEYHPSHVESPAHEYGSFSFVPNPHHGMAMESSYGRHMAPLYSAPQHPQPVYPAQWPSMLTNPSMHASPLSGPPVLAPVSTYSPAHPLPPLTTQVPTQPQSTARKTLTDQDRRRMCQYHEDNPSIKQTEIGAMFGVERSTVSKVLRQKEKYLFPEDGTRSPVKKAKGKFPDIERALSNWAKNHQRQGLPLSDTVIRDKARFFATTVGSSESHVKVNSNTWLEKFKQKNHLMGSKPRKSSESNDSDAAGAAKGTHSGSQTPNGISPISPIGHPSPSPISPSQSRDNLKTDSPDSYVDYKHTHSQSATSLASCFTDTTAPSSFSGQPSPNSPFYSPDVGSGTNPFITPARSMSAASANTQRGRSQTFPVHGIDTGFQNSGENMTSKQMEELMAAPALDTPVDEYSERHFSIPSQDLHHVSQPASSVHSPVPNSSPSVMAPPRNPLNPSSSANTSTVPSPIGQPSQDEARRALELVMNFFQNQPVGAVDPEEYITMGKLMEKLKVQGSLGELPGGMHSIDVSGQKEMSRKRSIHSL